MIEDPVFFQFEADFVDSLRCIPMQVRLKLDTCGVKLGLNHWHQLSQGERQQLTQLPCDTGPAIAAYRDYLQGLVTGYQGTPAKTLAVEADPAWQKGQSLPAEVLAQAQSCGCSLSLDQWQALQPLQRFALIKLSRPGHENLNFLPALVEFGLADQPGPQRP
ncbi:MAG: nitrate reductase maturation protein NarM [Leptolyngbyaceae cyanobacterium SM2_3_12]|nr:nitrate reductase maturation protein NarM [Leptolyngbyaceae cyanobacterium SM2_3_12]